MTRTIVDYYFTPQSPWTYLGHARFAAMARRADAEVRVRPVDFGAVFPVSGGLPLGKRAPQRQAYRLVEMARFSRHLGLPLNPKPKFFPVAGDDAAKLIIAAECGLDGRRAEQAQSQAVQERYDDYTRQAIEAKVFGAPSYVIDGEIFWGQDRLDFVEQALRKQA